MKHKTGPKFTAISVTTDPYFAYTWCAGVTIYTRTPHLEDRPVFRSQQCLLSTGLMVNHFQQWVIRRYQFTCSYRSQFTVSSITKHAHNKRSPSTWHWDPH